MVLFLFKRYELIAQRNLFNISALLRLNKLLSHNKM